MSNPTIDLAVAIDSTKGCSPRRLQSWATKIDLTVGNPSKVAGTPGVVVPITNSAGNVVFLAHGPLARPAYGAALTHLKAILALRPAVAPAPAAPVAAPAISAAWASASPVRAQQWLAWLRPAPVAPKATPKRTRKAPVAA